MSKSKMRLVIPMLLALVSITACGGSSNENISIPGGPQLTWTATWEQGSQSGRLIFQQVGQTATLTATPLSGSAQPPYDVSVNGGNCVTVSSSTMTTTVQVTSASAGTCTVTVGFSTIGATVP